MAGRGTRRVIANEPDDQPARRTGKHEQRPGSRDSQPFFESAVYSTDLWRLPECWKSLL